MLTDADFKNAKCPPGKSKPALLILVACTCK